jgi:hypothetical protein
MKIKYQIYDFVKWTVEEREREINVEEIMKHNAFFQRLAQPKHPNGSKNK